ncbi:MAG: hypothetical protein IH623_11795 [Verrucomicrobia bacterium]|nr:hypothetical protein [Verrucomicrobiota bacterium]
MKKLLLTSLIVGSVALCAPADVIKQWDFNTPLAETDYLPATGTLRPGVGSGTPAESVGGVANSFGQVSTVSGSSDPNSLDNTHWRLGSVGGAGGFPAQGTANKTAGAQFRVNTSGYNNIRVTWDQENSATASRYWRVQYTLNGTDWLDHDTVITANSIGSPDPDASTPTWQMGLTTDFSTVAGANNNPSFGFRLVSEFESTATGSGVEGYVANRTTSTYTTGGTLWLDMVTVSGDDLNPANQWPQISAIPDQITLRDEATAPIAFTISDAETTADNLVVSASSSNPDLVNTLILGGSGENRTIVAVPEASQVGTAIVTIRAVDEGGKMTESSFELTVTVPTLSHIPEQETSWDVPVTIYFTVNNLPGDPASWVFAGSSLDTDVVANSGITFGGTGTNYSVTITPVADAVGGTTIAISVTSGSWEAAQNFNVQLFPEVIAYYDLTGVPLTAPASVEPTTVATGLTVSDVTRGSGLNPANLTRGFSSDRWTNNDDHPSPPGPMPATRENAILNGDFYQFSITVEAGYSASLTSLSASLRRSGAGAPSNLEWQYSLDGFDTPGVTIVPRGAVWDVIGWTQNHFTYMGRADGTAPAQMDPYAYMTQNIPGQNPGNPMPTILLNNIAQLQNIPGETTVTFRLYGWGADRNSRTLAFGRDFGPSIRGTVQAAPASPTLTITLVGDDARISWPVSATGFTLESTPSLSPANWQDVSQPVQVVGDQNVVTVPIATGNAFFRLHQ